MPGRISSVCHRRSTSARDLFVVRPVVERLADPAQYPQHRLPRRLGRVRGEHRPQLQPLECDLHLGPRSPGNSSARRCMRSRSGRCSVGRRVRSSAERCSCSAVLASWKYWENARLSATDVPVSSPESRRVISAPPLSGAGATACGPPPPAPAAPDRRGGRGSGRAWSSAGGCRRAATRARTRRRPRSSGRRDRCPTAGGAGRRAGSLTVRLLGDSGVAGPLAAVGEAVRLNRASAGTVDASGGRGMSRTGVAHRPARRKERSVTSAQPRCNGGRQRWTVDDRGRPTRTARTAPAVRDHAHSAPGRHPRADRSRGLPGQPRPPVHQGRHRHRTARPPRNG